MTRTLADRLRTALARLARHDGGALAMPLALALPVLVAMALLVVDGGRYFGLHTSVQAAADSLALAAAAELDRHPDAITRANRAIDNLVGNDQRFGNGTAQVPRAKVGVRYMKTLPSSDSQAIASGNLTTDPLNARFVEITIQPITFTNLFAAAAAIRSGPTQASASAVAGFDQGVCNFAPVFICNPFEGTATNLFDGVKDPAWRRRLFVMKKQGGGGAQYFPGNYGFLIAPTNPGASALKDMIAMAQPKACFVQNGVLLRTGNIASVAEAMNVRFDMYAGNYKNNKSDSNYRPAQNVRKGYTGAGCSQSLAYDPAAAPSASAPALGFPRDACFFTNSCPTLNASMVGRIGDGNWDFDTYWAVNFGTTAKPRDANGLVYSNTNRPSRYGVYRHEVDNDLESIRSRGTSGSHPTPGEVGAPQCYTGGAATLSDDPDRRILYGAILDCTALDDEYHITGGSSPVLPVTAFGKFFLTEPMDGSDDGIRAELVDVLEPGTPGARELLRDMVQLYR